MSDRITIPASPATAAKIARLAAAQGISDDEAADAEINLALDGAEAEQIARGFLASVGIDADAEYARLIARLRDEGTITAAEHDRLAGKVSP
jgi:hypothetical protein